MALKRATYTRPSGQEPGLDESEGAAVPAKPRARARAERPSNRDVAVDGSVRESGDVGGNSRKSYLFCLTACPPGKRLSRSRQNGSVTLGKGLALRAGLGGPSSEPVDCWRAA
ncbi:hypothetical protein YC2023_072329 [Brassica napus]